MNLCFEETPEKRPTASFLRELLEEVWCTKGLSDSFVWFNIRTKTLNKCKIQLVELLKYQKMLSIPAVRGVQKHLTSVKYNWLSFWNIKKCCPSLQYVGYKPWAKAMFISSITAEWLEQSALLILLVNSSPIRLIGSWLIPDELTCSDIFDEMIWMNPSVDTKTI